ncbi:MAG TPA: DUF2892 domain-containing protein [Rhodobacteraceae bacterium]|nr:DUF2892 domain-containing protein [Paracoccaceae bacterium]
MKFNTNIGSLDRGLRILVGLVLFALSYAQYFGSFSWAGVLVGGILMTTAVFSFCPIYGILKMSTAKKD